MTTKEQKEMCITCEEEPVIGQVEGSIAYNSQCYDCYSADKERYGADEEDEGE